MQLSKRLQTVAHLVHSGGVVADIGCDHGFTTIYLVMNQLASAGIAMDVADGPLMRAKEHIHQYGLDNRIALRKSDGLQQLVEGEADTILISGIGGALMERRREFPHVTQSAKEPGTFCLSQRGIVKDTSCAARSGFCDRTGRDGI